MFEDYKKAVLSFYRDKRNKGLLSTEMENPNRERLRKECVAVFRKKNSKTDQGFVQSFFDPMRVYIDQLRSIEKFRLDNFRPLVTFLTQKEEESKDIRNDNSVKLLAWLLDFPNYEDWRKLNSEGVLIIQETEDDEKQDEVDYEEEVGKKIENEQHNLNDVPGKWKKMALKKWGLVAAVVLLLMGFAFSPRYMTWRGDRYEWLIFNTKKANAVAIDWDLIRDFRMVTRKDTLTDYSIGKLWYLKENNDHDVFTMGGKHPVLVNRNLRLLSKTILDSIQRNQKQLQSLVTR